MKTLWRPGRGCGTTAMLLLCLVGIQAAAGNLLLNGNFEDVNADTRVPRHWQAGDWSAAAERGRLTVVADSKAAVNGKLSARFHYEGRGQNLVLFQDVRAKPGEPHHLQVQCHPAKGRWASASAVSFRGGDILAYERSDRCTGNGAWQAISLEFIPPAEAERVRVILRCNGSETRFDAASLTCGAETDGAARQSEPSTAKELAETRSRAEVAAAQDAARLAAMGPQELAWERVLEANLGGFYLPLYKAAKAKGRETAWDFVADDPALPRVLLIGDSISRGYTVPVRRVLAGKVNVHRAPENCGPTTQGLKKLSVWLGDGTWDLIHFNFGIHDRASEPAAYAARLEKIVTSLKATGARLVWASSTPVGGNYAGRDGKDPMPALNQAAAAVMARHGIPVSDLHALMTPHVAAMQGKDGCHFNASGYEILGKAVAARILAELERPR